MDKTENFQFGKEVLKEREGRSLPGGIGGFKRGGKGNAEIFGETNTGSGVSNGSNCLRDKRRRSGIFWIIEA